MFGWTRFSLDGKMSLVKSFDDGDWLSSVIGFSIWWRCLAALSGEVSSSNRKSCSSVTRSDDRNCSVLIELKLMFCRDWMRVGAASVTIGDASTDVCLYFETSSLIGTEVWDDKESKLVVVWCLRWWWWWEPLLCLCLWWIVSIQSLDDDRSLLFFYNKQHLIRSIGKRFPYGFVIIMMNICWDFMKWKRFMVTDLGSFIKHRIFITSEKYQVLCLQKTH